MNRIKQELLAKVIRNKREKLELSQSQLASAAHINRAMISKIENGTYMPSIAQLEDLQEVLGYIDERFESYSKYNLEAGKRLALLALDLGQQLFDARKMLRHAKVQMDQMDQRLKELSSLLDEGQDSSEAWK